MTDREQFMHRALTLARLGEGRVSPNPMVGCVVVKDGRIISENLSICGKSSVAKRQPRQ